MGDLGGSVDLLQEHYPGQLVGERHPGEGYAGIGPLFQGRMKPVGGSDEKYDFRCPPGGRILHLL